MKITNIIAMTHLDLQNERFTREALEKAADDVNNGDKPLLTIDHDYTVPPLGKTLNAHVEPRGDGEYQLVGETEIFEKELWFVANEGVKLFHQESKYSDSPFADRYKGMNLHDYEVAVDPHNFDSFEEADAFIDSVRDQTAIDVAHAEFGRKSFIPDPEILIKIAEMAMAYLLTKDTLKKLADKIIDKTGDEIGEDVAKFYHFVRTAITEFAKRALPRNRPITYIFFTSTHPTLEFVARTTDPNLVLSALSPDKLADALKRAMELSKIAKAMRIQYLLDEDGNWIFNYLLTTTGGVIGTEQAYKRRTRRVELAMSTEKDKKEERDNEQPDSGPPI